MLLKDNINVLLAVMSDALVDDLAVTARTQDGTIHSKWFGDTLALMAMAKLMADDMLNEIQPVEG